MAYSSLMPEGEVLTQGGTPRAGAVRLTTQLRSSGVPIVILFNQKSDFFTLVSVWLEHLLLDGFTALPAKNNSVEGKQPPASG
jgi:hypothetical protein